MKITIDSYKNIHDLTIPVVNNKLILLGANGVGKTNTLEAVFYNECRIEDAPYKYARRFLLSMDLLSGDDYYPNANIIQEMFPDITMDNLQEKLMIFLENAYKYQNRPMMRKMIQDALDTLTYCISNQHFDPSPLAITRLAVLYKIYHDAIRTGEKYIVLVDSPELFAHPMMMDEIVNVLLSLAETGCLVIITTHNEHVISRFFTSFDEIVMVVKGVDGQMGMITVDMPAITNEIRAFYRQDEYLTHSFSRMSHEDDGLMELLENNLESYLITAFRDRIITIFFSETMVLGEGASEDVLFDYICNVAHPQWISEHQTGFLNCMGKSTMPIYFIFLNHLGIRTFVLYDLDNPANLVHDSYHRYFDAYHFANPSLFASYYLNPDLEGYLNITNGERVRSIIKPLGIFRYTYMQKEENPRLEKLINIMEENILRMKEAR